MTKVLLRWVVSLDGQCNPSTVRDHHSSTNCRPRTRHRLAMDRLYVCGDSVSILLCLLRRSPSSVVITTARGEPPFRGLRELLRRRSRDDSIRLRRRSSVQPSCLSSLSFDRRDFVSYDRLTFASLDRPLPLVIV